jgi:hypothetical protein
MTFGAFVSRIKRKSLIIFLFLTSYCFCNHFFHYMQETWSWHAYRFALGFLRKIGCDSTPIRSVHRGPMDLVHRRSTIAPAARSMINGADRAQPRSTQSPAGYFAEKPWPSHNHKNALPPPKILTVRSFLLYVSPWSLRKSHPRSKTWPFAL